MVFVGVSKFWETNLYSSILGLMAHTATMCCWLVSYCLSCVRSLASSLSSGETVLVHTDRACETISLVECAPAFISADLWLSTIQCEHGWLLHVNFIIRIWGEIQRRLYTRRKLITADELKQRTLCLARACLDQWRNKRVAQTSPCMCSCQRRTFKHLFDSRAHACHFLILWTLQVNMCYCVKYIRFFCYFWSFAFRK